MAAYAVLQLDLWQMKVLCSALEGITKDDLDALIARTHASQESGTDYEDTALVVGQAVMTARALESRFAGLIEEMRAVEKAHGEE